MDYNVMPDKPTHSADTKREEAETLPLLQPAPSADESDRRLLVFRRIAAPLMAVVSDTNKSAENPSSPADNATQFAALIDTTIALNQRISQMLNLDASDGDARWLAAAAATEIVAAHYRTTSHALSDEEAAGVTEALRGAIAKGVDGLAPPEAEPPDKNTSAGRTLKALAPVVSAIARFSFGRDPMDLLAEVSRRLTAIAADVSGKLGDSADGPFYYAVLEVAGEFYMESHFTEMERLLEMAPEERKDYVQAHNRKIPMEPVWERLGLKMGMLEALTGYLPGGNASDGAAP